jgi:hypothetical protein
VLCFVVKILVSMLIVATLWAAIAATGDTLAQELFQFGTLKPARFHDYDEDFNSFLSAFPGMFKSSLKHEILDISELFTHHVNPFAYNMWTTDLIIVCDLFSRSQSQLIAREFLSQVCETSNRRIIYNKVIWRNKSRENSVHSAVMRFAFLVFKLSQNENISRYQEKWSKHKCSDFVTAAPSTCFKTVVEIEKEATSQRLGAGAFSQTSRVNANIYVMYHFYSLSICEWMHVMTRVVSFHKKYPKLNDFYLLLKKHFHAFFFLLRFFHGMGLADEDLVKLKSRIEYRQGFIIEAVQNTVNSGSLDSQAVYNVRTLYETTISYLDKI